MNFFDLVFAIILIGFLVLSFTRGALREFLSTFGVVLGYLAAERFHESYLRITQQYIQDLNQARIITYLVIFAIGIVLGIILAAVFRLFYASHRLSFSSRLLGGIFGFFKAISVCLVIFHIVDHHIPSFADDLSSSLFYPWLQELKSLLNGINLAFLDGIRA